MRHVEGLIAALVLVGCSSSEPDSVAAGQDGGTEAGIDGASEASTEAAPEAGQDAKSEASESGPIDDAATEAPDSPQDAPTDTDAQTPVDAPDEATAPGACSPPGPSGNVADCSSLCSTYCEPACPGAGLPGGGSACSPYLICNASDPIWLTSPVERAFVLPAESGQHQGLDGTGVTCSKTCSRVTSFAFSVALGHCARLTSSGGRSFLQEGTDCSSASECAIVQGSQAGTVVRVLALDDAPAAWVSAQVDESWTGHPCPYSCP